MRGNIDRGGRFNLKKANLFLRSLLYGFTRYLAFLVGILVLFSRFLPFFCLFGDREGTNWLDWGSFNRIGAPASDYRVFHPMGSFAPLSPLKYV